MLSFIQKLADRFAAVHGYRPNVVYINRQQWQAAYPADEGRLLAEAMQGLLHLELRFTDAQQQPGVGWQAPVQHSAAWDVIARPLTSHARASFCHAG